MIVKYESQIVVKISKLDEPIIGRQKLKSFLTIIVQ